LSIPLRLKITENDDQLQLIFLKPSVDDAVFDAVLTTETEALLLARLSGRQRKFPLLDVI
jgi:hypothetical protein